MTNLLSLSESKAFFGYHWKVSLRTLTVMTEGCTLWMHAHQNTNFDNEHMTPITNFRHHLYARMIIWRKSTLIGYTLSLKQSINIRFLHFLTFRSLINLLPISKTTRIRSQCFTTWMNTERNQQTLAKQSLILFSKTETALEEWRSESARCPHVQEKHIFSLSKHSSLAHFHNRRSHSSSIWESLHNQLPNMHHLCAESLHKSEGRSPLSLYKPNLHGWWWMKHFLRNGKVNCWISAWLGELKKTEANWSFG